MSIMICGGCGKRVDIDYEDFEFECEVVKAGGMKMDLCGECADKNDADLFEQCDREDCEELYEPWWDGK